MRLGHQRVMTFSHIHPIRIHFGLDTLHRDQRLSDLNELETIICKYAHAQQISIKNTFVFL